MVPMKNDANQSIPTLLLPGVAGQGDAMCLRHGGPIVRFLCMLACFPARYFSEIQSWSDKVKVIVKGVSVFISPTTTLAVLLTAATQLLIDFPFIILLPVIAFCLDWSTMSNSWNERENGGLRTVLLVWIVRLCLAGISLSTAMMAALYAESENLQRAHTEHQRRTILNDPEVRGRWDLYDSQIKQFQGTRLAMEASLQQRPGLVRDLGVKLGLADKEAHGASGIDPTTGAHITGGGVCGPRCESYKADARAIEAQIVELDKIPAEIQRLSSEIDKAIGEQNALIESRLSAKSLGSLMDGFWVADAGIKSTVVKILFIVMVLELAALVTAGFPPSANLVYISGLAASEDELRSKNLHALVRAEISRNQAARRAQFAGTYPPVSVEVTDLDVRKTASTAERKQ